MHFCMLLMSPGANDLPWMIQSTLETQSSLINTAFTGVYLSSSVGPTKRVLHLSNNRNLICSIGHQNAPVILVARQGQNKIAKAGVSMYIEYFTVSQDVKVPQESLSHPSIPWRAEKRCFVVLSVGKYLYLICVGCFGFCLLPDLWGGGCRETVFFNNWF